MIMYYIISFVKLSMEFINGSNCVVTRVVKTNYLRGLDQLNSLNSFQNNGWFTEEIQITDSWITPCAFIKPVEKISTTVTKK